MTLQNDLLADDGPSVNITKHVLSAMQREQITRYILVSHPSVVMPKDRRLNWQGVATKYLWTVLHRRCWKELQAEANLLRRTNFAWTLVRSPSVKDVSGYGPVDVDRQCPNGYFVSLDRLARFLIHQKDCQNYIGEAIFIASRSSRSPYA